MPETELLRIVRMFVWRLLSQRHHLHRDSGSLIEFLSQVMPSHIAATEYSLHVKMAFGKPYSPAGAAPN